MSEVNLSDWVGSTKRQVEVIDADPAKKMAALLDIRDIPLLGEPLPPLWHWLYFTSTTLASDLGDDGHARKGGFLPPVKLPRRLWAGGRLNFISPLIIGAKVERISKILKVSEKVGKSGPLIFVTVGHELFVEGGCVLSEEHDVVYCELPDKEAAAESSTVHNEDVAGDADWCCEVVPDPVLMFRYSAVTFNGHRIHYDREYCQKVEGYSGLVFHGPLTATLMIKFFLMQNRDCSVQSFSFRASRPLFDIAPFTIKGKITHNGTADIWAMTPEGEIAMKAVLTYY